MAVPANREQFKDYCLRKLGQPVIEINVDNDQVEDRIDEALSYWRDFHHDAVQRTYMQHQLTSTDIANQYITANNDVMGVSRIFPANGSSGAGRINMFDLRYQIRLNDFISYRATEHLDFYLINRYLTDIDRFFVGETPIEFNRHMNRIHLYWDWENDAVAGEYIIIECTVALDEDTFTDIWSDRSLQRYATALIKRQWGNNMKKHNVTLLGGATMNGQQIYDEAEAEIEKLEQSIRDEFEEPPRFFTG